LQIGLLVAWLRKITASKLAPIVAVMLFCRADFEAWQ